MSSYNICVYCLSPFYYCIIKISKRLFLYDFFKPEAKYQSLHDIAIFGPYTVYLGVLKSFPCHLLPCTCRALPWFDHWLSCEWLFPFIVIECTWNYFVRMRVCVCVRACVYVCSMRVRYKNFGSCLLSYKFNNSLSSMSEWIYNVWIKNRPLILSLVITGQIWVLLHNYYSSIFF